MKKSVLAIFGLAAILALTGCGSNGVQPAPEKGASFDIESIELRTNRKAFLVGESYTIEKTIEPLIASTSEIVFSSSNPSVASVDSKGVVTGKSQGDATITVSSKKDSSVKSELLVHIFSPTTGVKVQNAILQQKAYQETHHIGEPDKLKALRSMFTSYKVDNEVRRFSGEYLNVTISKNDGYFTLGGRDLLSKYVGAPMVSEPFRYQFLTDADYHSHIFYNSYSDVHNRLYVPTEFYLDPSMSMSRYDVVCKMIDTMFTSGSPAFSKEFLEDSIGLDIFDDYDDFSTGGVDGNRVYGHFSFKDQTISLSNKDKENLDIPASVNFPKYDLAISVYFDSGNVKYYSLDQAIKYTYQGKAYSRVTSIEETFARDDEFDFDLPVLSDYTEVYSIFDLS